MVCRCFRPTLVLDGQLWFRSYLSDSPCLLSLVINFQIYTFCVICFFAKQYPSTLNCYFSSTVIYFIIIFIVLLLTFADDIGALDLLPTVLMNNISLICCLTVVLDPIYLCFNPTKYTCVHIPFRVNRVTSYH